MKKYVYLLTLGLLSLSLHTRAQDALPRLPQDTAVKKKPAVKEKITYGIQVGYNVSSVTNSTTTSFGDNNFSQHSKSGFNGGIFVEVPLSPMFHLVPELNYSLKGFKAVTDQGNFTRNYNFIDLPVLVKFFPVPHFYLYLGPQVSYRISTIDTWTDNTADFTKYERRNNDISKFYAGGVVGIGVDVTKHLIFNVGYSTDFTKNYPMTGSDTPALRNQVLTLRVGYRF